jgi:glycosyltransferase involved in cell wall biosynthesis
MIHYMTSQGIGQAWVAVELEVLERKGLPVVLHALRRPAQSYFGSEWAARIDRQTRVVYPIRVPTALAALLAAPWRFGGRFWSALGNALFGQRESARARLKALGHFVVACVWAGRLRRERVDRIHAQWAHMAATVGMYGGWLLDAPFSFTGHAVDLFRDRVALHDKIRRADLIVCISEFHRRFYLEHGARPEQLHVVYCGIRPEDYPFRIKPRGPGRFRILSVGRLVEKKGFDLLIAACRLLVDRGLDVECVIGGDGPLDQALQRQVAELGLANHVTVTGQAVLQEDLPAFLDTGDAFAQPCVWSRDNDVDGTPRTLMEAMARGLPSVSTRIAGIPEIVEDGVSGLLVEPGDVPALADALERLARDPQLAERLAHGGRRHIEIKFNLADCVDPLADLFRARLEPHNPVPESVAP